MPIAWIILIVGSFAAYAEAKKTGRSPFVWIVLVWLLSILVAVLVTTPSVLILEYGLGRPAPQQAITPVVIVGFLLGTALAVFGAGRKLRQENHSD